MSERSEARFKRALKDSANESLAGWEFTPAMRQAVLQQIADEEATFPAPTPAPRPWLERSRPLIWIGAAAAVLVVAVNIPGLMGGFGRGSSKSSPAPMTASSKPSASPRQLQEAPKAESVNAPTGGANEKKAADAAANSAASAQAPAAPAPSGQTQGQSLAGGVDGYTTLLAAAAPARIHLVAPEADAVKVAVTAAPPSESVLAKTVPAESLELVRVGRQAAVRTRESIQLIDEKGALIWEKPLTGEPGPLAALQGKIATSAGNELYLFDTDGRQELKVMLPQAPEAIVLSPDGRVAVTSGPVGLQRSLALTVYQNGQIQFQVNDLGDAQIAFGPDGSLAVAGKGGLQLFSREGARLWQAPLKGRGLGITFAAGGDLIVAGAEGFHRSGQPLWELALRPQEVFTLGSDGPVVLWEREQVTLVRPQDGTELWSAEPPGQPNRFILEVASSESGELVAVLARIDESVPAVWVLDQSGAQRYSARLNPGTFGVAIEGENLLLLSKAGPETRQVPAR